MSFSLVFFWQKNESERQLSRIACGLSQRFRVQRELQACGSHEFRRRSASQRFRVQWESGVTEIYCKSVMKTLFSLRWTWRPWVTSSFNFKRRLCTMVEQRRRQNIFWTNNQREKYKNHSWQQTNDNLILRNVFLGKFLHHNCIVLFCFI